MTMINREYKDRLFVFLFGSESHKDWILSLYNAVNHSSYTEPQLIQFNTIREILYLGMHNDVSFLIGCEMNLYEQQSSLNPNMPVRMLQYTGDLFEKYIKQHKYNKYGRSAFSLPAPRLVVFYNGPEATEPEMLFRLTDSFPEGSDADIEVTVRMINLHHEQNKQLLEDCTVLKEYMWVIDQIRDCKKQSADMVAGVDHVISKMPDSYIMIQASKGHTTPSISNVTDW